MRMVVTPAYERLARVDHHAQRQRGSRFFGERCAIAPRQLETEMHVHVHEARDQPGARGANDFGAGRNLGVRPDRCALILSPSISTTAFCDRRAAADVHDGRADDSLQLRRRGRIGSARRGRGQHQYRGQAACFHVLAPAFSAYSQRLLRPSAQTAIRAPAPAESSRRSASDRRTRSAATARRTSRCSLCGCASISCMPIR